MSLLILGYTTGVLGVVLPLAVAALAGGLGAELIRFVRDRANASERKERMDLAAFHPVWVAEMARIHVELAGLRVQVVALSDEVRRLGGDPLSIRYPITSEATEGGTQ